MGVRGVKRFVIGRERTVIWNYYAMLWTTVVRQMKGILSLQRSMDLVHGVDDNMAIDVMINTWSQGCLVHFT